MREVIAEKNGWLYETYGGRHKLSHTRDESIFVATFIQTGGVFAFDRWTDFFTPGIRKIGRPTEVITQADAEYLKSHWANLTEWA